MSMTGTWGHAGTRCRIKTGWKNARRTGDAFCYFLDNKDELWVVVQWDGEPNPDLHQALGLEIRRLGSNRWENTKR